MSKDEDNSVANAGRETRNALLVGLLLLLLLILAPLYWVDRAQQDLAERSRGALRKAGLDPDAFQIHFDGRDARLIGSQAQAAQLGQARRLVEGIWGVRKVSTRATAAAGEGKPVGVTLDAAANESTSALTGGPAIAAPGDSEPAEPITPPPEPAGAAAEPAPALEPKAALPLAPVTPEPSEAITAEKPSPPQPGALISEPPAAESDVAETPTPAPPVPATDPAPPQPTTTPGTALEDRKAPSGPVPPSSAPDQRQAAAEAESPAPEPEPAGLPSEGSPRTAAASVPPDALGTPPAPAIDPATSPRPQSSAAELTAAASDAALSLASEAAEAADSEIRAPASEISADRLLDDWPDLAAVENLSLEMLQDQVWLRGQVNSLADLQRIESQFPDSAAARSVQLDLQLAKRNPQELADYLNLVAATFRFRAGTSHFGPAGGRAMDRIADTLKSYPSMRLGLAGLAPETINPQVRRVHARHRAGATYRALLKRGVDGQQLFLADFASPFSPMLGHVPVAPSGPGQIQFFSLER